ncbi:hypothetical protein FRC04_012013 [Tulasnella sp. 424]|nr:hypothetical protein FRC04_012013 [Tulasnella sp. 424]KAG8971254.1 hypothetical protein FRC05_011353 [Tulasnella sp. 425]
MFRYARPAFRSLTRQLSTKQTTGLFGIPAHPDPLPALQQTYKQTLNMLGSSVPANSVYRQSVEASIAHKLGVIENAKGDVAAVENQLDEGQIEQVLMAAEEELNLVGKMIEWKPWEPLAEKPPVGQWEYFKE